MNNYNINDEEFINSKLYQDFLEKNPKTGNLKIRAYAASGAIPIKGLKIIVSTFINDNDKAIFFEGETNESGVIEKISLPVPSLDLNNMLIPNSIVYDVSATYTPDNIKSLYKVNMYEGVCVVQNINIVPDLKVGDF